MKFYIGSGLKNCKLVQSYSEILEASGWECTYDWTKYIGGKVTMKDLTQYAKLEQQGIADSDVVIILLPAGRGAHVELGMALALGKKVFLCADSREDFSLENTVSFYRIPQIVQLLGSAKENIEEILKYSHE